MTAAGTARCARCGSELGSRRADARWCGAACRVAARRLGDTLELTEVQLGWPPGEYPQRSRRFWAGRAAIERAWPSEPL